MKTAILFGSNGLIGIHLLVFILNNSYYEKMKVIQLVQLHMI